MSDRRFILHLQLPKPRKIGIEGNINIATDGSAIFMDTKDRIVAELKHARVMWAAKDGWRLEGHEPDGVDLLGREKFFRQEWFLRYVEAIEK